MNDNAVNAELNNAERPLDETDDIVEETSSELSGEEKLRSELDSAEARVLRAYADLDNYKKRFDREIARRLDIDRDKFINSILSVADNLRRALRVTNDESSPYREGLLSVLRHIDASLREFGAEQIPAEKGQQMDPMLHEAITTLTVPGVEHGSIIEVAEPGYGVGDRVVRPAKVVVAKSEDE
jgi:molecular chaperone GrpE